MLIKNRLELLPYFFQEHPKREMSRAAIRKRVHEFDGLTGVLDVRDAALVFYQLEQVFGFFKEIPIAFNLQGIVKTGREKQNRLLQIIKRLLTHVLRNFIRARPDDWKISARRFGIEHLFKTVRMAVAFSEWLKLPALANRTDDGSVVVHITDDCASLDIRRDHHSRDAHAKAVKLEIILSDWLLWVRRNSSGRRDVIVAAAVFVVSDDEQCVFPILSISHGLIDAID